MTERYLRQVIVVRKDLNMPRGKLAAMVAHASMTFVAERLFVTERYGTSIYAEGCFTPDEWQWLDEVEPGLEAQGQKSFAKIVLEVENLAQLEDVIEAAEKHGLQVYQVTDGGHSHNKFGDVPAVAIGPAWPEDLAPVTGHLKVYR